MSSLQAGEQLDHYVLESVVAHSGMGTIFRARDLKTGQQVAIKIPHMEAESDPVFFERFRREEEIGQRLEHPGIVKVFHAEKNSVYMAMEWVEGKLLRELLREQGKFSTDRAIQIALRICDALQYIHSHGIVHRDLKPENIMLDAQDNIKLLDFGIAGVASARRLTFGKLSPTMGTPDYISPEQVRGKRGDSRSDIYALGTMLYEMLAGRVPFAGDNPLIVMNARLHDDARPVREIDSGISTSLEAILCRALARDPKERYSSVCDFAHDLQHPDQVATPAPAPRSRKRWWPAWTSTALLYAGLVLAPPLLTLLAYVARHQ